MTGHNNSIQTHNPSFMTTLQATLDILDDVSGAIPENTYLTLTNNLQQLYNIHTSNPNSTSYANPPIITPINYTNNDYISNTSYASISNFDISYASLSNFDISNANTANANTANANNANIINNNNINYNYINNIINENIQSRIQSLNEESNRIGYSTRTRLALYNNVFNA